MAQSTGRRPTLDSSWVMHDVTGRPPLEWTWLYNTSRSMFWFRQISSSFGVVDVVDGRTPRHKATGGCGSPPVGQRGPLSSFPASPSPHPLSASSKRRAKLSSGNGMRDGSDTLAMLIREGAAVKGTEPRP